MKIKIYCFIMFVFLGCAQTDRSANDKSSNGSDTTTKSEPEMVHNKSSFNNLDSALLEPEKVIHLRETDQYRNAKHLPARIGLMKNIRTLMLGCMEKLEDLPSEVGQLTKLEELIIDNANGCQMNIKLPSSIGHLQNLKELVLYGALDARDIENKHSSQLTKAKELPAELSDLRKLEVLDLGRNGLESIPLQVFSLNNLRKLKLSYNAISEVPSALSKMKKLEVLEINANGKIKLPESLSEFKTLKVYMGNSHLTINDQHELQNHFPNIVFSFENEYDDGAANEE